MKIFKIIKNLLIPSFEVTLNKYEDCEEIQFKGDNNWNRLIVSYSLIVIIVIILVGLNFDFLNQNIFSRMITFFTLYVIGYNFYSTIKYVKNEEYLKREITFNRLGITLNHSKSPRNKHLIKFDRIKKITILETPGRLKFVINNNERANFEFITNKIDNFSFNKFIEDLCLILDLNFNEGRYVGGGRVINFTRKKIKNIKS